MHCGRIGYDKCFCNIQNNFIFLTIYKALDSIVSFHVTLLYLKWKFSKYKWFLLSGSFQKVMWLNGSTALSLDRDLAMPGESRIEIVGDGSEYNLVIYNADVQDEGIYVCSVFGASANLEHSLVVNSKSLVLPIR